MVEMHERPRSRRALRPVFLIGLGVAAALPLFLNRLEEAPRPGVEPGPAAPLPADRVRKGRIGRDGSIGAALTRSGLKAAEAHGVIQALRPVFNPRRSRPEDSFEVRTSSLGAFLGFKYWRDPLNFVTVRPDGAGGFKAEAGKVPLEERFVGAAGTLRTSLWEAMAAQAIPAEIIVQFAEIFAWQVDFLTEAQSGDTFRLVWRRRSGKDQVLDGQILLAQYQGRVSGHRTAVLHKGHYYDMEARSLRKQFLRAPLNYRRISSRFTARRYHPILRLFRPHHGIDFAAGYGTPVVSIGDGVVTFAGWKGGNGKLVEVRHNAVHASSYGHLARYAPGIRPGRRVRQNEVVGYVGSTGLSTGPHLHFGFNRHGRPVNFFALSIPSAQRLSGAAELAAFRRSKRDALILLSQIKRLGEPPTALWASTPLGAGASK